MWVCTNIISILTISGIGFEQDMVDLVFRRLIGLPSNKKKVSLGLLVTLPPVSFPTRDYRG